MSLAAASRGVKALTADFRALADQVSRLEAARVELVVRAEVSDQALAQALRRGQLPETERALDKRRRS